MEASVLIPALLGSLILIVNYTLLKPTKLTLTYSEQINNIKIIACAKSNQLIEGNKFTSVRWLDYLLSKSPSLSGRRGFYPTPYIRNGHLQTFFSSKSSSLGEKIDYKREILSLKDGGQVGLDWYPDRPDIKKPTIPTVIILHGLTGHSQTGYCRSTVNQLCKKNRFRCVVFNYRGCGGVEVLTPRTYNGGDTRDLKEVLEHIHKISPNTKLLGVGFSLGANILTKYLGEEAENSLISGAISIANPLNFIDTSRLFNNSFIQKNLLRS